MNVNIDNIYRMFTFIQLNLCQKSTFFISRIKGEMHKKQPQRGHFHNI